MEDRKKMHQSPGKPGASKQGKCLVMSSFFISANRYAYVSLQATLMRWLKTWLGLCGQGICEPFPTRVLFFFFILLKYFKPKTIVALHLFAIYVLWTVWMRVNCIHEVILRAGIYFDLRQHFPPANAHIIPQPHHQSASISTIFCHLATKYDHKNLTYYNNKCPHPLYPPVSNAYWQGWNGNYGLSRLLPINLAHLRLWNSTQKFKRRWSSRSGLIHLPMDLPQLLANLCSLMDAIIPDVHSREDALGHWQS